MEKLLKKGVNLYWDEECHCSLDVIKENIVTTPILVFPYSKKEFHVHMDASCILLGTILTQPSEGKIDHPIAFTNRKLLKVEKNYSNTKCEGLAMIYML